ncbi:MULTISPECIES: hypothetical protein [unclassified Acinetobacter]|uniref:hypothetical protein n=1 Tax=unclassified Acinetobacter TaxID=196816 RepID=UPI0029345D2E|nr:MULTISPECIES: hypothetical protein [unclassified Acinetobacter]WOE32182.1 hypothetical protein QSG84_02915 [Acinetobacter sp. SAAs470]WOE37652.1 hypothetical protein QSG86_11960 [Acinetobacter sp. SAAs474]
MKVLYSIILFLLPSLALANITPLQNLLLINDFETWLNNGESLINWENFRSKDINVYRERKVPNQIYYDFKRNIFNAEKEYGGKVVSIYGQFNSIERNNEGDPVIIFDLGYVNKLYTVSYTINEVEDLKVGNQLNLYCTGFFMDKFGDMSATCSMQNTPARFIAVNNIQHESSRKFLEKSVNEVIPMKLLHKKFNTDTTNLIQAKCEKIDSKNYNFCMGLITKDTKTTN